MTLETKRLGTGDDVGDLAAGDWRRRWIFSDWGLEMTMETQLLWSGGDIGDLATED